MNPGSYVLHLLAHLDEGDAPLGAALIAASSFLEHVFPPFPGDLGVTLGAAVGVARRWPMAALFAAAVAGSAAGSSVSWRFGRWLESRSHDLAHPWLLRAHDRALAVMKPLDRWGLWLVAVSRFVPAVRAFVVVAAGFRAMPFGRVLAASLLGAALWDGVLFVVATVVGRRLGALAGWLDDYNRAAIGAFIAGAALFGARQLWLRRRAASAAPPDDAAL